MEFIDEFYINEIHLKHSTMISWPGLGFETLSFKQKQETLHVVTIGMICSTLASIRKSDIFGGLYATYLNIYDGVFIAKIVNH